MDLVDHHGAHPGEQGRSTLVEMSIPTIDFAVVKTGVLGAGLPLTTSNSSNLTVTSVDRSGMGHLGLPQPYQRSGRRCGHLWRQRESSVDPTFPANRQVLEPPSPDLPTEAGTTATPSRLPYRCP